MVNALISGGTGVIGSSFIQKYEKKFTKIYRIVSSKRDLQRNEILFDFTSDDEPLLPEDIDVFFHFAAETSLPIAKTDPLLNQKVNCSSFVKLLNILKKHSKPPFVVLASTATQIGFTDSSSPLNEREADLPITIYDVNKLSAELFLLNYVNYKYVDGCSLRLTNVFGSNPEGYSKGRGVIDRIFHSALNGITLKIFGDGKCVRDYIYISDVVDAFYLAWEQNHLTNGKKFLVGSGNGTSISDAFETAVKVAKKVSGVESKIVYDHSKYEMEKIDKRSFVADASLFFQATGWRPKYNLESGLLHLHRIRYANYDNPNT